MRLPPPRSSYSFSPLRFLFVPGAGALAPSRVLLTPRRAFFLFPPPVRAFFYYLSSLSGTSVQASSHCTAPPVHTSIFSNSSCVIIFSFLFFAVSEAAYIVSFLWRVRTASIVLTVLSPCRFDSAKIRPLTTRFQIIRQCHLAPRPLFRTSISRFAPFPQSHSAPYPFPVNIAKCFPPVPRLFPAFSVFSSPLPLFFLVSPTSRLYPAKSFIPQKSTCIPFYYKKHASA